MEKFSKHCMSVVTALYVTELKKRIAMDVYKTAKVAPKPTSLSAISSAGVKALKLIRSNPTAAQRELEADWDRVVWDDETSIVVRSSLCLCRCVRVCVCECMCVCLCVYACVSVCVPICGSALVFIYRHMCLYGRRKG